MASNHASRSGTIALACGLIFAARWAAAAVAWHTDVSAAVEAARTSGKPVLAVFNSSWNEPSDNGDVFAHPEVAAVVSACFEAVRVDVDASPALAREFKVEHVPEAFVLDAEGKALTRFECSSDASEFVATAARAAQLAAATASTHSPPEATEADTHTPTEQQQTRKGSATATASALAHKVRNLAGFAEADVATNGQPSRFRPVPLPADVRPAKADSHTATPTSGVLEEDSSLADPSLARTPPLWPAEPATTSAFAAFQPASPASGPANPAFDANQPVIPQPHPGSAAPAVSRDIEPAGSPANSGWMAGLSSAATDPALPPSQTQLAPPAVAEAATALPSPAPAVDPAPAPASATASMIAFLQKPWSVFSRPKVEPTVPPPTLPPARSITAAAVAASAPPSAPDRHGSMPLGLEGYCPVTLAERGTWVEGRAQWGARHRGRTYLFAGPEQQQAFLGSPDRYAPALSGDDPVVAFESNRSEPGRRAYGVTYQARMYLFSSPETRAAFTADPGRYTARVMLAEGIVAPDQARRF